MNIKRLMILAVVAPLVFPAAAFPQNAAPFNFGLGALGTWERDAGEPGQPGDPRQFGLYLQKHTATSNFAASGARITDLTPVAAEVLEVLAFDIPGFAGEPTFGVANGYCGAGAPRFNVASTGTSGTCFLGCTHGVKTQNAVTGWWEIRFDAPFNVFPGCETGISGTVTSLSILFDEGDDIGPGNVILDNIRINNTVIGRPRGD